MSKKFVYCTDEGLSNKLDSQLELVSVQVINDKKTWIFENNNKVVFAEADMSKLDFTNKLYI